MLSIVAEHVIYGVAVQPAPQSVNINPVTGVDVKEGVIVGVRVGVLVRVWVDVFVGDASISFVGGMDVWLGGRR